MKSNLDVAKEILEGKWGNGSERKKKLVDAGYNYEDVQGIVNALLSDIDFEPVEEKPVLVVNGTETMEVEVDLNKYKALKLTFVVE